MAAAFRGGFWNLERAAILVVSLSNNFSIKRASDIIHRTTWHQLLRLGFNPPVAYLMNSILHVHRGTYLYNYGTVFSTFFLSGCLHAYGAYFASASTLSTTAIVVAAREHMKFFMLQACGIWFEENVAIVLRMSGLLGKRTPKGETPVMWKRLVGYVWTAVWLGWTTRAWLNNHIMNGMFVEDVPPYSFGRWLWTSLGVIKA
jgi:hypothetical protein